MTNQITPRNYIANGEPVLLHHTNSNSNGKVITYFAHPDLSGIKLSPFTFDPAATLAAAFYSTAWEVGFYMGVVR